MVDELKRLSSRVQLETPYFEVRLDQYRGPHGEACDYHYVHSVGSVMVVPCVAEQRFLLVNQYRYLNQRPSLEFPGGALSASESEEQGAARELAEEGGVAAGSLVRIGAFNPCTGLTDEICTVFLAENLSPVQAQPDPTEELERCTFSADEINHLIRSGEIWDGMTLAAWSLLSHLGLQR